MNRKNQLIKQSQVLQAHKQHKRAKSPLLKLQKAIIALKQVLIRHKQKEIVILKEPLVESTMFQEVHIIIELKMLPNGSVLKKKQKKQVFDHLKDNISNKKIVLN